MVKKRRNLREGLPDKKVDVSPRGVSLRANRIKKNKPPAKAKPEQKRYTVTNAEVDFGMDYASSPSASVGMRATVRDGLVTSLEMLSFGGSLDTLAELSAAIGDAEPTSTREEDLTRTATQLAEYRLNFARSLLERLTALGRPIMSVTTLPNTQRLGGREMRLPGGTYQMSAYIEELTVQTMPNIATAVIAMRMMDYVEQITDTVMVQHPDAVFYSLNILVFGESYAFLVYRCRYGVFLTVWDAEGQRVLQQVQPSLSMTRASLLRVLLGLGGFRDLL